MAPGPSGWVAVGSTCADDCATSDPAAWVSVDGLSWSAALVPEGPRGVMTSVASDGRTWFAAGVTFEEPQSQAGLIRGHIWRSPDGITWSLVRSITLGPCFEGCPTTGHLAAGPGGAVLTLTKPGSNPRGMYSTVDGESWKPVDMSIFDARFTFWPEIAPVVVNGRFVVTATPARLAGPFGARAPGAAGRSMRRSNPSRSPIRRRAHCSWRPMDGGRSPLAKAASWAASPTCSCRPTVERAGRQGPRRCRSGRHERPTLRACSWQPGRRRRTVSACSRRPTAPSGPQSLPTLPSETASSWPWRAPKTAWSWSLSPRTPPAQGSGSAALPRHRHLSLAPTVESGKERRGIPRLPPFGELPDGLELADVALGDPAFLVRRQREGDVAVVGDRDVRVVVSALGLDATAFTSAIASRPGSSSMGQRRRPRVTPTTAWSAARRLPTNRARPSRRRGSAT